VCVAGSGGIGGPEADNGAGAGRLDQRDGSESMPRRK
jgi:hypothetical protein